jgi:hypothetical protein
LVFVDLSEDSIMMDDVAMPLNLLGAPLKEEDFEETSFDVNVSQLSHEEKLSRKMVHTQIDRFAWDH